MKNAFRLTLVVLAAVAFACDPSPRESKDDKQTASDVDSIANTTTHDSIATHLKSDSIPVSK